jgi:hypothetical protein
MRSIRCTVGVHAWERHVVREDGGQMSLHQRCTRCGDERSRPSSSDPVQAPDARRPNLPRKYDSPSDW